jgi:hypothetical protein
MNLTEIQVNSRLKLLKLRSLDYLLHSSKFERAYDLDAEGLLPYIDDVDALKVAIDKVLRKNLLDKSLKEVRDIAGRLGILHYNQYNKEELIMLIKRIKHAP